MSEALRQGIHFLWISTRCPRNSPILYQNVKSDELPRILYSRTLTWPWTLGIEQILFYHTLIVTETRLDHQDVQILCMTDPKSTNWSCL